MDAVPAHAPLSRLPDPEDLPAAPHPALLFDWDRDDPDMLRRMMARATVDLETAVQMFFNGMPERYNMIAKADLLPQAQARCNLLDSIHRRIACGFYLPDPERGLGLGRRAMQDWIARQEQDWQEGRSGRWTFAPDLLDLSVIGPARPVVPPQRPAPDMAPAGLWCGLWQRLRRVLRRDRRGRAEG